MGYGWLTVWRSQVWDRARHAFDVDATVSGSGSADAHVGQLTFLYVTRPVGGVVAVLSVAGPPRVPDIDLAAARSWAKTIVDYQVHAVFDPPIPIAELRDDLVRGASYPVRRNMNLTVAALTEEETGAFVELAAHRQPDLLTSLAEDAAREEPLTFASERNLEQWLIDNLDRLSDLDTAGYRLADAATDGIAGRQPTLPTSDTRPDLVLVDERDPGHEHFVVVEVKNVPARPEHVGQLAHYVSWIRQHLSGAADARGLLVTTGNTLAASTAVQAVPGISHMSVADIAAGRLPAPFDPDDFTTLDLLRAASNVLADRLTCFSAMLESRSFASRDGEADVQRVWEGLFADLDRLFILLDATSESEPAPA
jgi:hypothetical protein